MKKKNAFKTIVFILFCFLLLSISLSIHTQEKTIRLTNGEWSPYLSEDMEGYGIASQIVTEAFGKSGITVQYGFFPWSRSYELARQGVWDGTVVWHYSDERAKYFHFSEQVIQSEYVFFHLKDYKLSWKNMDDLDGISIGATNNYFYGDDFEDAEKENKIKVYRVNSDLENFRLLIKKRIQIFPIDSRVGYAIIKKEFPPNQAAQFIHNPRPVISKPMFLMISKKNENAVEIISAFNKGLQKLKKEGRYQEILKKSWK